MFFLNFKLKSIKTFELTSWFLARSGGRIADIVGQTFAMGFAGLDDARFALGAGERLARIDALADAVDIFAADGIAWTFVVSSALVSSRFRLAADGQVVGIPLESIATDAGRPVSVGDANGVGSALLARTGVDTTTDASVFHALIDRKTNLSTGAIQIVATRRDGALPATIGRVTGQADALPVPAGRIRPALDGQARIDYIRLDGRLKCDGHAHHERIAGKSFLTATVVTSGRVQTNGVGSASVPDAFVDI